MMKPIPDAPNTAVIARVRGNTLANPRLLDPATVVLCVARGCKRSWAMPEGVAAAEAVRRLRQDGWAYREGDWRCPAHKGARA